MDAEIIFICIPTHTTTPAPPVLYTMFYNVSDF